ncbi:MAG: selenoneine biosynthesis selenosugar synthase SenB [Alphaproteobacteria bacterium]
MKISLVTPAGKLSRAGNRTTAVRWARILGALGHRVAVSEADDGADADMMVAVHAWRSAASIRRFSDAHPDRPLVVLLAGTDIYRFQNSHPDDTLDSMARATALVCLHDLVHRAIPRRFAKKLHVIHQSALPLPGPRAPSPRFFEVCVAGHLREEKDSLRAAYAARQAEPNSRLRVVHLGKAHNEAWASDAACEMKRNARFVWRDEVPGWQVRRQFARSHAMVISSVMEGGANVVSEAIVAGLPVLASKIDGNVGLLGEDYAGYFPPRDTDALAALLTRAETEPGFLKTLAAQNRKKRPLFRPAREAAAWRKLLRAMGRP